MGWSRHSYTARSERERAIFSMSSEGEPLDLQRNHDRAERNTRKTWKICSVVFECNNPFQDQVPNRFIVAMCEQAAFNGYITKYPFRFEKFNLSSIKQMISGEEYPYETLELKHDGDDKDLRGY